MRKATRSRFLFLSTKTWITLHETGNVAGFNPVLVMDVWEHACLLDYQTGGAT
jgi:superoxide dismutase